MQAIWLSLPGRSETHHSSYVQFLFHGSLLISPLDALFMYFPPKLQSPLVALILAVLP